MERLRKILDEHEASIQSILYHKRIDFEKRHLIWKQKCSEWTRQGKNGVPYPEPQMYPEYLVRQNNHIQFLASDLEEIYKQIKNKVESL